MSAKFNAKKSVMYICFLISPTKKQNYGIIYE